MNKAFSTRSRLVALVSGLILLPSSGCDWLFPEPEGLVACQSNDDCLPGWVCRDELDHCVLQSDVTGTAPVLDEPTLSRGTLGPGEPRVTLEIKTDAVLATAPEPELLLFDVEGQEPLPFTLTANNLNDDGTASYELVLDASPPAALADRVTLGEVVLDLVDVAGQVNRGVRAGQVVLDYLAPSVTPGTVAVRLEAAEDSKVSDAPTIATVGTTVFVSFSMDEPSAVAPELTLSTGQVLTPVSAADVDGGQPASATAFAYQLVVEADVADGAVSGTVVASDDVGNQSVTDLGVLFVIDATPPDPPLVGPQGSVVFFRAPWGEPGGGGQPRTSLIGAPGAAEPDTTVLVYDPAGFEIGRLDVDDEGGFEGEGGDDFNAGDRTHVLVSLLDAAGNESAQLAVRDVVWTATLAGDHPHQRTALPRFTPAFEIEGGFVVEDEGQTSVSARATFIEERTDHFDGDIVSAAYDRVRGKLVVLQQRGGVISTWELERAGWIRPDQQDPEGDGGPDLPGELVFNPLVGAVQLVITDAVRQLGTDVDGGALLASGTDVWTWRGESWELDRRLDDAPPTPLQGLAFIRDAQQLAGVAFSAPLASDAAPVVWSLGDAGWESAPTDGDLPRVDRVEFLEYDTARSVWLTYGGSVAGDGVGALWELSGTTWSELEAPEGEGPGVRLIPPRPLYDPLQARTYFSAVNGNLANPPGLWSWDGSVWIEHPQPPSAGQLRPFPSAFAYDEANARAIVFVGGCPAVTAETWSFANGRYAREHRLTCVGDGPTSPPAEPAKLFFRDPVNQQHVLVLEDEVWALREGSWRQLGTRALDGYPDAELSGAFAWDTAREVAVLLSTSGEVWEWDGRFTKRADPDPDGVTAPATGDPAVMGFDVNLQRAVALVPRPASADGGAATGLDTWAWDGGWQLLSTDVPDPDNATAVYGAMTFDRVDDELLLFVPGALGQDGVVDAHALWAFDGTSWTNRFTDVDAAASPVGLFGAAFWFNSEAGRPLLFGGGGAAPTGGLLSPPSDQLWAWTGSAWRRLATTDAEADGAPTGTQGAKFAAPLLWGGASSGGLPEGGLWTISLASSQGVAQRFDFRLDASARSWRRTAGRLTFSTSASDGAGVSMRAWDGERWRVLASGAAADGELAWEGGETTLRSLLRPDASFAVAVNATTSPMQADTLTLDAAAPVLELQLVRDAAACGDGEVQPDEACDDGNAVDGDGCSALCRPERCGDGLLQSGETCDDGNLVDDDGCSADCVVSTCGDGVTQPSEACDDSGSTAACDDDCTLPVCGDGVLNVAAGEGCDDGNTVPDDGCAQDCTAEFCGDGVAQGEEPCDPGGVSDASCLLDCRIAGCGDGVFQLGEACDDGNLNEADGCTTTCQRDLLTVMITEAGFIDDEAYFEITNHGDAAVDLSDLSVVVFLFSDGGSAPLAGSLSPGQSFVVTTDQATFIDVFGTFATFELPLSSDPDGGFQFMPDVFLIDERGAFGTLFDRFDGITIFGGDEVANRLSSVSAPSDSFSFSEWSYGTRATGTPGAHTFD
jgi:cysteine-rich repeat protein